ncbi:MAG: hypothetical protein WAO78_02775 [Roseovarius sp.]
MRQSQFVRGVRNQHGETTSDFRKTTPTLFKISYSDHQLLNEMHRWGVAEQGRTDKALNKPDHPYTRLLILSVPEPRVEWCEEAAQAREAKSGIAAGVKLTEVGCPFRESCSVAIAGTCENVDPPRRKGQLIECHRDLSEFMHKGISHLAKFEMCAGMGQG